MIPGPGSALPSGFSLTRIDSQLSAQYLAPKRMTLDFTCRKCEASFEVDAEDLIDGTEKLVCPHCNAKAPSNISEDFVSALTEMRAQVAVLGKKFAVNMSLETEDLEDELEAKKEGRHKPGDEGELDFEEDDVEDDDEEELDDEDMGER